MSNRYAHITSSQVSKLMGAPKPKKTYIQELIFEKKLKRSLPKDHSARPTTWGNVCERYVFENHLGLEYKLTSKEPIFHPEIQGYSGMPDGTTSTKVYDIKCPYTLKSFCELSEIKSVEDFEDVKPEYFWQLVSNSILTGLDTAELIVFMPRKEELQAIQKLCEDMDDNHKYFWLNNAFEDELPYLPEAAEYEQLFKFEFEVTDRMKRDLLIEIKATSDLLWT